ncbi:hypothetical protein D3273_03315 [Lichenibacterium minor]|uniref:Uncharacterized protein n=1 Tax=Lichenibacterium minor TaxID=2316528 RepID=A0A4Q2UDW8_9HYPH|nr:hypothetical protein [Lichenibacterium minor]RYC33511.1 hypothetical protein D3273_03315 [Lichenibacterium minor]
MDILIREKNNISDPEKQFERYVKFNKELVRSDSMFGLEYMKSSSPVVRDIFVSENTNNFSFARCEGENTLSNSSCLLVMSQDRFVIEIGMPRSELKNWKQIEFKVGRLIRGWIKD